MPVGNTTQQGFPNISSKFCDSNGNIQQAWLQLLIQLWNKTGGGSGSTTDPLEAIFLNRTATNTVDNTLIPSVFIQQKSNDFIPSVIINQVTQVNEPIKFYNPIVQNNDRLDLYRSFATPQIVPEILNPLLFQKPQGPAAAQDVGTSGHVLPFLDGTNTWSGIQSFSSGTINFTNSTSNVLLYNTSGSGPPTFTTRSAGAKIVLSPAIGATSADYAFGIDTNTIWIGVPTTSTQFKWYAGTTLVGTLSGTGVFTPGDLSGTRTALGLGTAAVQNIGTSGANVPLMNTSNTWTTQTFSVPDNSNAVIIKNSTYNKSWDIYPFSSDAGATTNLAFFNGDGGGLNFYLKQDGSSVFSNAAGWRNGLGLGTASVQSYTSGTWIPTIVYQTPGTGTIAYTTQTGSYIQIGKLIYVDFTVVFTPTVGTASGEVRISNWPQNFNDGGRAGGSLATLSGGFTGLTNTIFLTTNSTTYAVIGMTNGSATTYASVTNLTNAASHTISGSFVYITP